MKIFNFFITLFLLFSSSALAANVSVTFVLDESGSISSSEFQLETQGFVDALNSLPADGSIEISIIGFATGLSVVQDVTPLTSATYNTIHDALSNNPKSGGSTYMGNAISQASTLLSASSAQTKIIFLATDGSPTNASNARSQATNAKNAGIVLTPIGIGLGSSGKTFLDSIASNPPVPNPSDFNEFGTVVRNIILGGVSSNAGLELTPGIVSFGSYTPTMLVGLVKQKTIILNNKSSQAIALTRLAIEGVDADQFRIDSIAGKAFLLPLDFSAIPPKTCTTITVSFRPNMSQDSFDASLVATGVSDGEVVSTTGTLLAKSGPGVTASMDVAIFDAIAENQKGKQLIDEVKFLKNQSVYWQGYYYKDKRVEEPRIKAFNKVKEWKRTGLIADGNARVLVRVQTDQSGDVEFHLDSTKTKSKFENLTMTKVGSTIKIPTEDVGDGIYQATAVLVAEERFPGEENEPIVTFDIDIDLLDSSGTTLAHEDEKMNVRRAPVVLIHGLWGDDGSWGKNPYDKSDDSTEGLAVELKTKHFRVGYHHYNNWEGPRDTMPSNDTKLSGDSIGKLCDDARNEGYACSRADIVGHSMGGLVAREFIRNNSNYRDKTNFQQGDVRRLITLGTPHEGSGFGNLVGSQNDPRLNNQDINSCIDDEGKRDNLVSLLNKLGKRVGTAIADLAVNSTFLVELNTKRQDINSFGIIGDAGQDFVPWTSWLITRTGCTHADLFNGIDADTIVSVDSARGNFAQTSTLTLNGVEHLGMGTNNEIIVNTIRLLNGPLSAFSVFAQLQMNAQPVLFYSANRKSNRSIFKNVNRWLESSLSVFFGVREVYAADVPVTLTISNNAPSPGDTVTFYASITGNDIHNVVLTDGGDVNLIDNLSPYRWTFNLPQDASDQRIFKVVAVVAGTVVESNNLTITIKPDLTALDQLSFSPGHTSVLRTGSTEQLNLIGLFNDGYNRNLTKGAMETVYSEAKVDGLKVTPGDSPVISVSSDGMVTAIQEGTADVVATNNGITTSRRIIVKKGTWKDYFAKKFPWLMFIPAFINGN